ncbi:hypothetical protein HBA55_24350 [Pseudomaricurvus alkylphenolicus]|uniref:hypothetical protein n=1 Tax=Pseudomaricurvus alkylphenolicus TaxID=1306991 RepID=UPI0014210852|nr:hypothetical protein [Pseudomaricurvus alkylphenolicus]NIB42761.1 hypothetical protein [Pseudomaricurvus alkylphenolicus]
MKSLLTLIAAYLLVSCTSSTQAIVGDPCYVVFNSDDSDVSEEDAKQMVVTCLEQESIASDELAEYLKAEFFQDHQLIVKQTEAEGETLVFAKDWIKCQSDVFFSSKKDLIDLIAVGAEKYFESRSDRSMQAHCVCEEQLSGMKPEYKKFYDNPENRACKWR